MQERRVGNEMRMKMEQELKGEQDKFRLKMESFKRQQMSQLEENKRLRNDAQNKELALDKRPASGHDIMHAIYLEKKHASYDKRV